MLDMTRNHESEPWELDEFRVLKTCSSEDWLFKQVLAELASEIFRETTLIVSPLTTYSINGPYNFSYVGDLYLTAVGPSSLNPTPKNFQKAVGLWRWFASPDVIFHLNRYSQRNGTHWIHFVITNNPLIFDKFGTHGT